MIGNGTFMGGVIPRHVNINGEPHQLSYINRQEAGLLSDLGGAGKPVFGVPAYFEAGSPDGIGDDASNEGFGDMGLGGYSDAVADAVAQGLDDALGIGDVSEEDVTNLGMSLYGYDPDTTPEQAQSFTDMGLEAGLDAGFSREELDYYNQMKREPYSPPRGFFDALKDNLKDNPFSILSPTTLALQSLFNMKETPQMDPMGVVGNVGNQPSMMGDPDDAGDSAGDYYQREYIQPVAQPIAIVENVAAPVVAAPAPNYADATPMMRPSTFNVAPVNAPADYGLLYPEQERRFQESFALRPEFYSGPLDTTGYQPVASLLI